MGRGRWKKGGAKNEVEGGRCKEGGGKEEGTRAEVGGERCRVSDIY